IALDVCVETSRHIAPPTAPAPLHRLGASDGARGNVVTSRGSCSPDKAYLSFDRAGRYQGLPHPGIGENPEAHGNGRSRAGMIQGRRIAFAPRHCPFAAQRIVDRSATEGTT